MPTPPTSPVRYPCHCLRCGHEWEARKQQPKACPGCNSTMWHTEWAKGEREKHEARKRKQADDEAIERALPPIQAYVTRINPQRAKQGGVLRPGQSLYTRELSTL